MEVVNALLQAGADVNVQDKVGEILPHCAKRFTLHLCLSICYLRDKHASL